MVGLFEKIEEVVEFEEAANTPIPGKKVVNTAYLLIIRTGGMEKSCEQWEYMQVGLKNWQAFKEHLSQACAIISTRKHQRRPMGMRRQKIIHRKQRPKSTLRMR